MKKFFRYPIVLTLAMIITFTWFSYLWWQDQKMLMLSDFAKAQREIQTLPDISKLPTPPASPQESAAAAGLSQ